MSLTIGDLAAPLRVPPILFGPALCKRRYGCRNALRHGFIDGHWNAALPRSLATVGGP